MPLVGIPSIDRKMHKVTTIERQIIAIFYPESIISVKHPLILYVMRTISLLIILFIGMLIAGCTKNDDPTIVPWASYLGNYSGTAVHAFYHSDADWNPVVDLEDWTFEMTVETGVEDSSLCFLITYNDTILETYSDVLIDETGLGQVQWGAGSSASGISVQLHGDTIDFYHYVLMGMGASTSETFQAVQ